MFDDTASIALDFHHSMLSDGKRTTAFLEAILRTVRVGDVVVDIGCGTGVLSMFACLAGARKVYAIEQGPVLGVAREIADVNGYADRIEFVAGWSTDIELPEPANVVVTETIGNMAFDEGIVATAVDARERFLERGGTILPGSVRLIGALVESFGDFDELDRWSHRGYSFDFTPLRTRVVNNPVDTELSAASLVSSPMTLLGVDLGLTDAAELCGAATLVADQSSVIHGVGCWFSADLGAGVTLTSEPPNAVPSWMHGLLPLAEPLEVDEGEGVRIEVATDAKGETWSWRASRSGRAAGDWQCTSRGRLMMD